MVCWGCVCLSYWHSWHGLLRMCVFELLTRLTWLIEDFVFELLAQFTWFVEDICLWVTASEDMVCWGHLSLNYCVGGHGLLRTFVVKFLTWFIEDACLPVTVPEDLVCWGHFVFELLNWWIWFAEDICLRVNALVDMVCQRSLCTDADVMCMAQWL